MRYFLQEKAMRMIDARFPRNYEPQVRSRALHALGLGEEGERLRFSPLGVVKALGLIIYFKSCYDPIRVIQRITSE